MPSSPSGPVRRAQLIAPFGVGAMVVVPGGTSLIVGGLDYWFKHKDGQINVDAKEFIFEEWRLQEMLLVDHFRLPPDFREAEWGQDIPNIGITIPTFRFPTWHFCADCRLLLDQPMYVRGRIKCPECESKKKTRYMFQVPLVAMCERGHLQDFPWKEWVHNELNPTCLGPLRLKSTGSASLSGQKVICDYCKKERTLAGVTSASPSGKTTLSSSLIERDEFLCRGKKPWLGPDRSENCNAHLRGSLKSASNLYYAHTISSIYLPKFQDLNLQKIEELLQQPPLSTFVSVLKNLQLGLAELKQEEIVKALRGQYTRLLTDYSDSQVIQVLEALSSRDTASSSADKVINASSNENISFRRKEFIALRTERNDQLLKIKKLNSELYDQSITRFFSNVMLVNKLQETRVLTGFSRIYPENGQDRTQCQSLLWNVIPENRKDRWLPAYIVYGEGIFFEFDENLLSVWENKPYVISRIQPLTLKFDSIQDQKHLIKRIVSPRFILLHTFSHIIMNRLTFECGYSSAALRERLYVSIEPREKMAGVLIYTADGDSEGTMGGLVRMGKPGNIEPIIRRALEGARWCSADPVCMEMGRYNGQGPDSCNLAACHNCALVPETACEEFNRLLDRAVVIGEIENPSIGFFNS